MGDVKLALLLGAMLGRLVGVGLMLGMMRRARAECVLLARHGSAARKMGIPFAPFLAAGSADRACLRANAARRVPEAF